MKPPQKLVAKNASSHRVFLGLVTVLVDHCNLRRPGLGIWVVGCCSIIFLFKLMGTANKFHAPVCRVAMMATNALRYYPARDAFTQCNAPG